MTAELVPIPDDTPTPVPDSDPWARYWRMAQRIANTEMVPAGLRGRPDAVLAVALYGEAVGIHPMIALQQISFIAGKPVPSAELQRSLILAAGHRTGKLDGIVVDEERRNSTDDGCTAPAPTAPNSPSRSRWRTPNVPGSSRKAAPGRRTPPRCSTPAPRRSWHGPCSPTPSVA